MSIYEFIKIYVYHIYHIIYIIIYLIDIYVYIIIYLISDLKYISKRGLHIHHNKCMFSRNCMIHAYDLCTSSWVAGSCVC
jgi:hypothetical protein